MKLFESRLSIKKNESINVSVRVRPFMKHELAKGNIIFFNNENGQSISTEATNNPTNGSNTMSRSNITKIRIGKESNYYEGNFNKIFDMNSTQSEVFEFVKNVIPDLIKGINNTIFAYGQTGSGKTYTMFGSDWTKYETNGRNVNKPQKIDKNGKIINSI